MSFELSLLNAPEVSQTSDEQDLRQMAAKLLQSCQDFKVPGKVDCIRPGPIVTTLDYQLAPGVKSSKLVGLAPDLALALSADSIRVAPANGTPYVSVEVPNEKRRYIYLRDLLQSKNYRACGPLPLPLGVTVTGEPTAADLSQMPHLLIAGTTGSGKSVALNAFLLGLLYRHGPESLKLVLIDIKRLEFGVYAGLPHLLQPIATDPQTALLALQTVLFLVEARYELMAPYGVRNLESYNRVAEVKMPYIVVAIDEVADLMISSKFSIAEPLTRIAQIARAAGVHLLIGTQRPSVDVVSGLIKTNFPSRLVFRTASKVDSSVTIGDKGAEMLLGKGDALLMQPGHRLTRFHTPLVDEFEVDRVVKSLVVS
jgi:DNA segregation ATPase FtsK/SpoIIIE, S-DNA-T family